MYEATAKSKHVECVYDICNYHGYNAGAWADLYENNIVVFGGMWHGNTYVDDMPNKFMPKDERPPCEDDADRFIAVGDKTIEMAAAVCFGVQGDIQQLLKTLEDCDELTEDHFKGLKMLNPAELSELLED